MADENKIEVQIVLDDGSVVRGFTKIEEQAKKTGKEASKNLSDIDTDFSVDGVVGKLKSLVPISAGVATAVGSAFAAIGIAFERAFAGEKLIAAEKQFNNIAEAAGLSGAAIERALVDASQGTFDFSDNIQTVNQAIIELGASASRLPEIMKIARQSSVITGQSIDESFRTIVNAIESGNVKALRQAGIFVDADKALAAYAKTLGITSNELNLAQRQQAILNATMETAAEKFKNVDASARPMQSALDRIKVAFNEIADASAKAANKQFGEFFAINLERVAAVAGNTTSKTALLNSEIARLEKLLANKQTLDQTFVPQLEQALDKYRNELKNIEAQAQAASDDARKAARFAPLKDDPAAQAALQAQKDQQQKLDAAQIEAERNRANQIAQIQMEARQQTLDAENQRIANIPQVTAREAEMQIAADQQKRLLEEQHQIEMQNIRNKYSAANGYSQAQTNAALLAEDEKYKAKLLANEQKIATQKKAIEQSKIAATQSALGQIASLQDSSSRELFEIGKIAGVANATISGYQAINNAYANIPAPFNIAAAAAVGVAAFANVQKIASMQFGGGVNTGSPAFNSSAGGGGINAGITTPVSSPALAETQVEQKPAGPKIEVNIAGNILNTRESSLHVIELINEAYEQHGAIVAGAV